MPFHRESVILLGSLHGLEREATCTVIAEKVSLPGTDMYEYARLLISGEPKDLPDGQYDLVYEGGTVPVQLRRGTWIGLIGY